MSDDPRSRGTSLCTDCRGERQLRDIAARRYRCTVSFCIRSSALGTALRFERVAFTANDHSLRAETVPSCLSQLPMHSMTAARWHDPASRSAGLRPSPHRCQNEHTILRRCKDVF